MMTLNYYIPVPYVPRNNVRAEDLPPTDDPFFYGWRDVFRCTNGTEEWGRIPLTLEDVLYPQMGDYIVQNHAHDEASDTLKLGIKGHLSHEPQTVVLRDTGIDWEVDDIKPLCPDIAVIRGTTVEFPPGVFFLKRYGGRVDLIVEITSPSTWKVDVEGYHTPNKVELYARLGVKYYIIIDMRTYRPGHTPSMRVLRLNKDGCYEQMKPDKRGWYWIDNVDLWIGPYKDWVSWYDAEGNKIGTYIEVNEDRKREAEARKLAEERTQYEADARQREADARKLAEERAQYEADARKLAEERAQYETDARQRADDARKLAEERAQYETDARQRAEERIRELEALLRTTRQEPDK